MSILECVFLDSTCLDRGMPEIVEPLEKAETRTLSLPRGDWEYLAKRGTQTKSDRSKYVRALIAKDRNELASPSAPDALSETIIEDLARRLCGEMVARRIETKMQSSGVPYSQANLLKALLDGLDRFFEGGGYFTTDEETFDSTPWVVNSTYLPLHALLAPAVVIAEGNAEFFRHKAMRSEGDEAFRAADSAQRWERRRNRAMAALRGMNDAIDDAESAPSATPSSPRKRTGVPQPQQPGQSSQSGMSASG